MNYSQPFEKINSLFHSFSFFNGSDGSTLEFFPESEGSKFVWYSPLMYKVGAYNFIKQQDILYLELEFNYGRESFHTFTLVDINYDIVNKFIMDDKHGRQWTFILS